MHIILASKSPRRQHLLDNLGLDYKVVVSDEDETISEELPPEAYVSCLAERKARAVAARSDADDLIIGADTVVVYDGLILGKPEDESDAFRILAMLSGGWHEVYTGLALVQGDKIVVEAVRTRVQFSDLSSREIECYVASGEPMDKAGAYGIQGLGASLIMGIEGDYFNVVGLPVCRLRQLLKEEFDLNLLEEKK